MIYKHFLNYQYGTFAIRIRSDNDTDNSYSTLTSQISVTLPNQTPFSDTQTNWSAPSSTCNDTSLLQQPQLAALQPQLPFQKQLLQLLPLLDPAHLQLQQAQRLRLARQQLQHFHHHHLQLRQQEPVIVKIGGEEVEYTQSEVDDGTVDRDIERQDNEDKYGFTTNAQIDQKDCDIPKEEEKEKEVIIVVEDEQDIKTELPKDDDVVLDVADKDEDKDIIDEPIEEIIVIQKI